MAFNLSFYGGFGSGKLGDVTDPPYSSINAYAAVIEVKTYSLLVIPISNSQYQSWDNCVGEQILFHCVAKSNANPTDLGEFLIATITNAAQSDDGLLLTIDTSTANIGPALNTGRYWQAILIPQFKNLTLQSKSVKPDPFSLNNVPIGGMNSILAPCGGVIVFKCSQTFYLAGGHVDLRDAGFSPSSSTLDTHRPLLNHEKSGTGVLDTDLWSGAENSITKDHLLLNAGDGACLIMASYISSTSGSSRIGNPATFGVQYCRGAADSNNAPSNVTNVGGSSILLVANTWNNFTPAAIAKYRTKSSVDGRGLARAYLAIRNPYNNILPDEGLYAQDVLPDSARVKSLFNLYGFGNGQNGTYTYQNVKPPKCYNQYAAVTAISGRVYTISKLSLDVESIVDWNVGAMVMIHQTRKASATDYNDGSFKLSRITAVSGSTVTIKHNFSFNLSTYYVQMIVVPEFNNLTLQNEYVHTPLWSSARGGGICAIAVANNFNFAGGKINTEGKGTFKNVVNPILGNVAMKGILPLGQGHGSVLIIAKNLVMNSSTRIGATYDGSKFGGDALNKGDKSSRTPQGGFKGTDGFCEKYPEYAGTGGSGGAAGTCQYDSDCNGGWHSSAANTDDEYLWGCQGAHVLIIADSIDGLNIAALSTGGEGGLNLSGASGSLELNKGGDGGCGYGGGGFSYIVTASGNANRFGGAGGYRGGAATGHPASSVEYAGGGGSGSCFVYANTISNQINTGVVLN